MLFELFICFREVVLFYYRPHYSLHEREHLAEIQAKGLGICGKLTMVGVTGRQTGGLTISVDTELTEKYHWLC
jgi:hypothetical protein